MLQTLLDEQKRKFEMLQFPTHEMSSGPSRPDGAGPESLLTTSMKT